MLRNPLNRTDRNRTSVIGLSVNKIETSPNFLSAISDVTISLAMVVERTRAAFVGEKKWPVRVLVDLSRAAGIAPGVREL